MVSYIPYCIHILIVHYTCTSHIFCFPMEVEETYVADTSTTSTEQATATDKDLTLHISSKPMFFLKEIIFLGKKNCIAEFITN